ncbi:MAG: nucleotidyltransferase domain-containing protein [Spirochaetaceae bacterium]|nr:nucleotidyltransferase domain-containing protein [Spirochaetaceae bacterium]
MLEDILAGHRGIRSAVLYGSRATGAYRNGSDIDLTLHVDDSFSYNDLLRVKEAFNASDIPYMVDISDYRKISNENLKDHIQRAGKVLYRREGEPPG